MLKNKFIFWILLLIPSFALAEGQIGTVASVVGKVIVLRAGKEISLKKSLPVFENDQLITYKQSAVKIIFFDGSNTVILESGSMKLKDYYVTEKEKNTLVKSSFNVVKGKLRLFFKPDQKRDAKITTANSVLGIRGTAFFIDQTKAASTKIVVESGVVSVQSPLKLGVASVETFVKAGEQVQVEQNLPPPLAEKIPAQELAEIKKELNVIAVEARSDIVPPAIVLPPIPTAIPEKPEENILPPKPEKTADPKIEISPVPAVPTPVVNPEVKVTPNSDAKPGHVENKKRNGYIAGIGMGGIPFFSLNSNTDNSILFRNAYPNSPLFVLLPFGWRMENGLQFSLHLLKFDLNDVQVDNPSEFGNNTGVYSRQVSIFGLGANYPLFECNSANPQYACSLRGGAYLLGSRMDLNNYNLNFTATGGGLALELSWQDWFNKYLGYTVGSYISAGSFDNCETKDPKSDEVIKSLIKGNCKADNKLLGFTLGMQFNWDDFSYFY